MHFQARLRALTGCLHGYSQGFQGFIAASVITGAFAGGPTAGEGVVTVVRYYTRYSHGTHTAHTRHSHGAHTALTGVLADGLPGVLTGYSQG